MLAFRAWERLSVAVMGAKFAADMVMLCLSLSNQEHLNALYIPRKSRTNIKYNKTQHLPNPVFKFINI